MGCSLGDNQPLKHGWGLGGWAANLHPIGLYLVELLHPIYVHGERLIIEDKVDFLLPCVMSKTKYHTPSAISLPFIPLA